MAEIAIERDKLLFPMCSCAIVATAFGFVLRGLVLNDWGVEFHLDASQQGALSGVGLWPFALSMAVFSLIIDKIGFRLIFWFALACHIISTIMLLTATGYQQLFWGTFLLSLGNGAIESAANPLVASVYRDDRIRWLSYLHAGWPAGQVLGGLLTIALGLMGAATWAGVGLHAWKVKIGLILIPMLVYGVLLIGRRFPVTERVAGGVSYKDMLKDAGGVGAFAVSLLAAFAIAGLFVTAPGAQWLYAFIGAAVIAVAFFFYTKSIGNPLYLLILLMMMPQAITELGTAGWVSALMEPRMAAIGVDVAWVLVATNAVLLLARVNAGQVVHRASPVMILAVSAAITAVSMVMFAYAGGLAILGAALLFGLGTAFFWPTTLGFVSEQFPRSGSVGINFVGAAGMLAAGTIGATLMGAVQDKSNEAYLQSTDPAAAAAVLGEPKTNMLGAYRPIDQTKVDASTKAAVDDATANGVAVALKDMALLPAGLLVLYLLLTVMFRSKGGYKRNVLHVDEESMSKAPTGA
ncbi:MAG: fucose permease [Caulobacteraceae bacterium]|nr:fucose permease [Caulobacteraceae bacterium]